MPMINALSIDLEPWCSPELVRKYLSGTVVAEKEQLIESLLPILAILSKYETKATFFVLGLVAEKYPEIVREIHERGHEIASHAYSHRTLYELGANQFEAEIKRSVELLESITGEKPIGFRAPSFSIDNATRWAFKILAENGFKYDSSIFPIRTMLYGVPGAPLQPYRPSMTDVALEDQEGKIIEFPMTILKLGKRIPVAGGFYLRVLPLWFLRFAIARVNKTRPAIIYLHPWETHAKTPRLKNLPLFSRFVTYYGINSALRKLEGLLERFKFKPLREFLDTV